MEWVRLTRVPQGSAARPPLVIKLDRINYVTQDTNGMTLVITNEGHTEGVVESLDVVLQLLGLQLLESGELKAKV